MGDVTLLLLHDKPKNIHPHRKIGPFLKDCLYGIVNYARMNNNQKITCYGGNGFESYSRAVEGKKAAGGKGHAHTAHI